MSKPAGFERLAILKPDHLGDLVLAIPAIRHLLKVYPESALFCASANEKLARFLFPEAEVKCVDFPVLAKSGNDLLPVDLSIFKIYDALVCLRNDGAYFTEKLAAWIDQPFFISAFDQTRHETDLQREVVEKLAGSYSRSQYFFGDRKLQFPESISRGGLAPAAGFSGNQWPLNYWIELGQALLRKNCEISLVGGPAEREILRILSHALEVPSSRVIVGISDFSGFLARVSELNLVIATDSGTAHLCSLVAPLLSIFGPSPFRRFAPFGRHQRVVTYDVSCSPCVQFEKNQVNVCLSRECLTSLSPAQVMQGIEQGVEKRSTGSPQVFSGVSHLQSKT